MSIAYKFHMRRSKNEALNVSFFKSYKKKHDFSMAIYKKIVSVSNYPYRSF